MPKTNLQPKKPVKPVKVNAKLKDAADRSPTVDRWGKHLRKKLAEVLRDIKKGHISDADLVNKKMRQRYEIGDPMAKKIKEALAEKEILVKKGSRYKIADKYRKKVLVA